MGLLDELVDGIDLRKNGASDKNSPPSPSRPWATLVRRTNLLKTRARGMRKVRQKRDKNETKTRQNLYNNL